MKFGRSVGYVDTLAASVGLSFVAGAVVPPDVPGLEFTAPTSHMHYSAPASLMHYTSPADHVHYTVPDED